MNKFNLPHVGSFAILWRFESLAAGTPVKSRRERQGVQLKWLPAAESLLNVVHFLPLPRIPRHPNHLNLGESSRYKIQ